MEIRGMVKHAIAALALCLLLNSLAQATDKTDNQAQLPNNATIRFYKINRHQQTSKIKVSKNKTSKAGCHNFRGSPRVLTLVQTGFLSCSVYTEPNCPKTALIKASNSKSDGFSSNLSQGYAWYIKKQTEKDTKGVKLSSWSCKQA